MSRIRFRTAGLATLALSGSLVFAAPVAHADSGPCEVVLSDDVITTIVHPAVVRTVAPLTHTEWAWSREVAISESEFSTILAAASVEVDWTRELQASAVQRFARTVVDQAPAPAGPGTPEVGHLESVIVTPVVVETEDEYRHETTGNLRWERSDWGAQNGQGRGWKKTGAVRQVEITPAVTAEHWVVDVPAGPGTPAVEEQSHVESVWGLSSPGADWVPTGETRPGTNAVENATTTGEVPDGAGWRETARRETAALLDTVWAGAAPVGYVPTGAARVVSVVHEVAPGTSAQAPEGEGWVAVDGSEVVVIDAASYDEVVTPELIELLLSPPEVSEDCDPSTSDVAGPLAAGEAGKPSVAVVQAPAQGAPAEVATVLPNTGNGVQGWMAPVGLASALTGAVIALGARRRPAR